MSKKIFVSLTLCVALQLQIFTQAYAEEIVISGNGANSQNEVSVESNQNTAVHQDNSSEIQNNVDSNANTGDNTSNSNQGDTAIKTGDTSSEVNISNENINANVATNNPCCTNSETTIKIENNGAESNNIINSQTSQTVNSNQNNNTVITNNITVKANTGSNTASYNNGHVVINTGSITSSIQLDNSNINSSVQHLSFGQKAVVLAIHNNAADSINKMFYSDPKTLASTSSNNSFITNNIMSLLNTGKNTAKGNTGDVYIKTGGILSLIEINNSANSNFLYADCDCEKPENPSPTPTITPAPSPKPCIENCHPSSGSVGGASASSAASGGDVLPATGSYLLYFITLASLITFFSGWYLRYRSGIAPGK